MVKHDQTKESHHEIFRNLTFGATAKLASRQARSLLDKE